MTDNQSKERKQAEAAFAKTQVRHGDRGAVELSVSDADQNTARLKAARLARDAAAAQQKNQQLMEQADANLEPTTRMQQYQQAEQQLVNDVALSTLYQQATSGVRKPCVVGTVPNAQTITPPDDWANIYITTNPTCANTSQYQ